MPQVEDDALWTLMEQLVQEGKIRSYGAALGPAIGWLYEGVDCVQRRRPHVLQHIYNAAGAASRPADHGRGRSAHR